MKKVALFSILFSLIFLWPGEAQVGTAHSVTLTWVAPTTGDAPTSYNVKRALVSGGPYATIGSTAAPTVTFTDTAVSAGTTYFYVVTAANSAGESGPSNEVSAAIPLAPPGAPGSLAVKSKQ